jgi:hypothetical protein
MPNTQLAVDVIKAASARTSSIQAVGNFQAFITNASTILANGFTENALSVQTQIKGIKLEDTFLSASQMIDSSKRVPLIDGSTAAITNMVTAGVVTFRCVRVGTDIASGDLPTIAAFIQKALPSLGSIIQVSYTIAPATSGALVAGSALAAKTENYFFVGCTLVRTPPIILAGNDVPVYEISFSYDDYYRTIQ